MLHTHVSKRGRKGGGVHRVASAVARLSEDVSIRQTLLNNYIERVAHFIAGDQMKAHGFLRDCCLRDWEADDARISVSMAHDAITMDNAT
mmetsp:Transcript_532/g.1079  ORF Transcript_532/g.1079 Transcript_532/m.1079 type:complete len:90 (-) Transcript_532:118-387(-)